MENDEYSTENSENCSALLDDTEYSKYLKFIQEEKLEKEKSRKERFDKYAAEQDHIIFTLQGLNILKFTDIKIKFCFQPSLLYEHISKKLLFYCSLKYLKKYNKWTIRREPMPAKPLFGVASGSVHINDNFTEIGEIILKIYKKLCKWSEHEVKYREKKYQKYQAGILCYMDIDSTDEELYFSEHERQALFEKRQAVLKRMLPPAATKIRSRPKKTTKLKYRI